MKYYMFRLYTIMQDGVLTDKSATYVFDTETAALKQYYKMLAADIDDNTKPSVLCLVMNDNGIIIAKQKFIHQVEAPAVEVAE